MNMDSRFRGSDDPIRWNGSTHFESDSSRRCWGEPMGRPLPRFALFLSSAVGLLAAQGALADDVLGNKPRHVWGGPSSVPNGQAITRMIWAPGLDDGYVPQGVTWAEGAVFLSAYRSTDPKIGKGPCRVFKVDAQSGETLAQFDLPKDCGHAGGLAHVGNGFLVVSDTPRLYKINSAAAFSGSSSPTAIEATVKLGGEVKGSFVGFDGTSLFVGSYDKDADKAKGHFLPLSIFDTHRHKIVTEGDASRAIPLPTDAQGAAFDRAGMLWLSASSSKFGRLYRLESASGRVLSSHDMVIGIEDLAFDERGKLWSVSEAGSLRWQKWSAAFPVLFQVDPSRLK